MGKGICLYFPRWIQKNFFLGKFDPRGPLTFKMKTKQQEPLQEEIPIWAMVALKISRKCHPQRHQPYDLPILGQIKILINQVKNLISQQGMIQSPENLLMVMLCWPVQHPARTRLTNYLPNPPLQVIKQTEKRPIISTNDSTHMPPPWNPHTLGSRENDLTFLQAMKSFHCLGPRKLCINIGGQTCAFVLPPKEDFQTLLPFFCL